MGFFNNIAHKMKNSAKKMGKETVHQLTKSRSEMEVEIRSELILLDEHYKDFIVRQRMIYQDENSSPTARKNAKKRIEMALSSLGMVKQTNERLRDAVSNAELADNLDDLSYALRMINHFYSSPDAFDRFIMKKRVERNNKNTERMEAATYGMAEAFNGGEPVEHRSSDWDSNVNAVVKGDMGVDEFIRRSEEEEDPRTNVGTYQMGKQSGGSVVRSQFEQDEGAYWENENGTVGDKTVESSSGNLKLTAKQLRDLESYSDRAGSIRG